MERLAFVEPHFEIVAEPETHGGLRARPAFVFITFASEMTGEASTHFFFAEATDD